MRVGITGATGFIGTALSAALIARGDTVIALGRETSRPPASGVETRRFDVNRGDNDPSSLAGLDAVVHLAGERIDGRWTLEKKRAIFDSRVSGTRRLNTAMASLDRRPAAIIAASATGYYGDRGNEVLDENSGPGGDFLADVCIGWEREVRLAAALGIRTASLRTGVVLGDGGAMAKLRPIFKAGTGGPLGSGRQWMPWIHIHDLVRLYIMALDQSDVAGPVAAVSPDYASNWRVMAALGRALGRPALARAPSFALRIVLGEFAESLLGGQLVMPSRAMQLGFRWEHPELDAAMIDAVAGGSHRLPATEYFSHDERVRAPLEEVFEVFRESAGLARSVGATLVGESKELKTGATFEYARPALGRSRRWKMLVLDWVQGVGFTEVLFDGPYLWWKHVRGFERDGERTTLRDRIEYALPLAPLSNGVLAAVRRDIEEAFAIRRRVLDETFGG